MLTRQEIFEGLKEILLIVDPTKNELVNSLSEDSRLIEDVGLSSVSMLYLVIAIEEKFEIEFGDLSIDDFKTVKDAIDYIEKELK